MDAYKFNLQSQFRKISKTRYSCKNIDLYKYLICSQNLCYKNDRIQNKILTKLKIKCLKVKNN